MRILIKFLLLFTPMLISLNLFANSVSIDISPNPPVVNEEFEVIFKVTSAKNLNSEPYISFNPGIAEVKGKKLAGKQSSARVVNGKFSTSTTYNIVYTLVSPRAMVFHLTDIVVDIDGEKINVPRKAISVGVTRAEPKEFFLRAELNKTTAYVGEGLDLNYYLYSRVQNVGRTEIEIFPKLNNFIKRFYMPKNERETVDVDGVLYRRSLEYSSRIFPEKSGVLKIDPLKLKFQYTQYNKNRGFGAFGFAFGRPVVKSLSSPVVEVNVAEVPTNGMPSNYTGLVGEHEFEITVYQNKFLVNEAIEVKLDVRGPGALENYPAPVLYQHQDLEKFDTKSELSEVNKVVGKKTFEYTYLARNALNFKTNTIEFSYFNPETLKFESKSVNLPPIVVGGSEIDAKSSGGSTELDSKKEEAKEEKLKRDMEEMVVLAPNFENIESSLSSSWIKYMNIFFSFLIIIILVDMIRTKLLNQRIPLEVLDLAKEIEKNGINYSRLNKYIRTIPKYNKDIPEQKSLLEIVENLELSDNCKKYFSENIQKAENMEYNETTKDYEKKYIKKYFNEINQVLARR